MGELQGEEAGRGPSRTALIVGTIAVALGGTALFGMVAHTWTPLLPQRGGGPGPFDMVARAAPEKPPASTALIPKSRLPKWIPFAPREDEFIAAAAAPPAAPIPEVAPPAPIVLAAAPIDAALPPEPAEIIPEPAAKPVVQESRIEAKVLESVGAKPRILASQELAEFWTANDAPDVKPVVLRAAQPATVAVKERVAVPAPRKVEPVRAEVKVAKAKPVEVRRAPT